LTKTIWATQRPNPDARLTQNGANNAPALLAQQEWDDG
jgi:hypothetical protein